MAELKTDSARLLYTWIIPHLDIKGRLEADPNIIKGEVVPRIATFTLSKIQEYLEDMASVGLVTLYRSDGDQYLELRKFEDHQSLRLNREAPSRIPSPDESNTTPGALPEQSGITPAEVKIREEKIREEKRREVAESSQSIPDCPQAAIIELYHSVLPELPRVVDWTPARQSLLRTRWKTNKDRQNLEWWKSYFTHVAASDFLMGKTGGSNGRKPFQANLEWLIRPQNMAKVVEGNYHDRAGKTMEEEHGLPADIF